MEHYYKYRMRYREISEILADSKAFERLDNAVIQRDLNTLRRMISSSASAQSISEEGQRLFAETIKGPMRLYRGISLIANHRDFPLTKEQMRQVAGLKKGDVVPDFLLQARNDRVYCSFTKKLNVAKHFSRGSFSLVMTQEIRPSNMLVDLSNLYTVLQNNNITTEEFDADDWSYCKRDQEVFVRYPLPELVLEYVNND